MLWLLAKSGSGRSREKVEHFTTFGSCDNEIEEGETPEPTQPSDKKNFLDRWFDKLKNFLDNDIE